MQLECFVLGTSGSLPLPYRSLTSVLVRREGEEVLFDCGEGTQLGLHSLRIRWKQLKVICISHSHADHVTGIPGILMLSSQVDRSIPLLIICPRAVKRYIDVTCSSLNIYLNYKIEYVLLEDVRDEIVYRDVHDTYCIRAFTGNHTRAVWGFVLQEHERMGKFHPEKATALKVPKGNMWAQLQKGIAVEIDGKVVTPDKVLGKSRKGRKIVYVTDTRPCTHFLKYLKDADLAFCEATFKHEHHDQAVIKKHMTNVEAAHLMKDAGGVKRAGLLHFSPRYTFKDILALEKEAKAVYSAMFTCRESSRIVVPYQD